jgi:hypothetical protein
LHAACRSSQGKYPFSSLPVRHSVPAHDPRVAALLVNGNVPRSGRHGLQGVGFGERLRVGGDGWSSKSGFVFMK